MRNRINKLGIISKHDLRSSLADFDGRYLTTTQGKIIEQKLEKTLDKDKADKLYINKPITDKEAIGIMKLPWQTNLNLDNKKIINVDTCTEQKDGTNKNYVDEFNKQS